MWAFVESLDLGPFYDRIESVEGHAGRPAIDPGEPSSFDSSEHGTRTFCPRGGTPLTFASTRSPTELDITTCSLENPQALPPKDHTRTSAMLAWVKLADELPEFPEARP